MRINYMGVRLVKEQGVNYSNMITINSPSSVVKALNDLFEMDTLAVEHMVMVMLDSKHRILGVNTISTGTVNSSLVSPREVFQMALLQGAVSIVIAHNHPSGNPSPSPEDIAVTKRIQEAGKLIGVNLLDHLIVGDGRYTSLKEDGYI